jgi:methyltransferase (TIGR00027 family)
MPPLPYLLLQLLLLPVTLAFAVSLVINVSRFAGSPARQGQSITAALVLMYRWVAHELRVRPDAGSALLFELHPVAPHAVVRALFVKSQLLAAFVCRMRLDPFLGLKGRSHFALLPSRILFFDAALAAHQVDQFVIMGAGFDTRAYANDPSRVGFAKRVFEVDRIETQLAKRRLLEQACLAPGTVTFVPVNFASESWTTKLTEAGFDATKSTFVLWEGVASYLPEQAVVEFLTQASALLSQNPRSRMAFNFRFREKSVSPNSWFSRFARFVGEPHLSSMFQDLPEYFASKGVKGLVVLDMIQSEKRYGVALVAGAQ